MCSNTLLLAIQRQHHRFTICVRKYYYTLLIIQIAVIILNHQDMLKKITPLKTHYSNITVVNTSCAKKITPHYTGKQIIISKIDNK